MNYPWYRWWSSDFHGDARVRLMTAPQRGAYRDLLDLSWQVGPLADPEAALEAIGWTRDLWPAIRPCWVEGPDGWTQGRLESERRAAQKRSSMAAHAVRCRENQRTDTPPPSEGSSDRSSQRGSIQNQNQNQKRKKNPPNPPLGGKPKFDPLTQLPEDSPDELRSAWAEWVAQRREAGKALKPTTTKAQLRKLTEWGPARFEAALRHSTAGGYQGLYEPKTGPNGGSPPQTALERIADIFGPEPTTPEPRDVEIE